MKLGALKALAQRTKTDLDTKVDKVTGKQLSTEDYTTAEKTKLAGVAEGAQVNIIESISIDGTNQTVTNKAVALDLGAYAKKSDVAAGVRVKGTVANFAALPANASVGDMYNVTAAGGTDEHGVAVKAGDNLVKTETGWDNFGGTIDFSAYLTKTEYAPDQTKLNGIEAGAQVNVIESVSVDGTALTVTSKGVNIDLSGKVDKVTGKQLSTEDYTTAEKTKLTGIETGAQVNVLESISVDGTALTITSKGVNVDLSGKLDKLTGSTQGNLAAVGANGVIVDSGVKFASDTDVNAMLVEVFGS